MSEFPILEGRVERVAMGLDDCWTALIDAEAEVRRRQTLMAGHGARDWAAVPGLQRIVVIVDEAFDLLSAGVRDKERRALQDEAADALGSIARVGRTAGVHLLLAAQRPDAKVLAGELRNNLRCRLLLGEPLKAEILMVLDGVDDDPPTHGEPPAGFTGDQWPPKGRGFLQAASPSTPVPIQCYFASDEQVEELLPVLEPPVAEWAEEGEARDALGGDGGGGRIALDLSDADDEVETGR